MKTDAKLIRCSWCSDDEDYIKYHDTEWGVPLHGDKKLFELLTLEGAQAGLSWLTVLKRRPGYRRAFNDFDIVSVSKFNDSKISKLLTDTGIIRNKLKIMSVIKNAQAILEIQKEFGSLDNYFWNYVNNVTLKKSDKKSRNVSVLMSKDLKKRGMNFVGPTICYSFMQSNGMINDHDSICFRYKQLV